MIRNFLIFPFYDLQAAYIFISCVKLNRRTRLKYSSSFIGIILPPPSYQEAMASLSPQSNVPPDIQEDPPSYHEDS